MKLSMIIFSVVSAYALFNTQAIAFQDRNDPILDSKDARYLLPNDLTDKPLADLIKLRDSYTEELNQFKKTVEEKADKEKLLNALSQYDADRIRIVEAIPNIIKDYKIKGDFKTKLESYAETFSSIHKEYSPQGSSSIDEYKRYGFRIVTAYASMLLYIMTTDPKLHERLTQDMHNQKTVIGQYVASVGKAHDRVEAVNAEVKEYHFVRQIRGNIDQINALISDKDWPGS